MLKSNLKYAEQACQWIMIYMVTNFLSALWYLYLISTADSIFDVLIHNDVNTQYVTRFFSWASTLILVCTAIFFIRWYKTIYHNCYLINRTDRVHSEDMAVAAWFIPIANLIVPLRVMRDAWELGLENAELGTEDRLELERIGGLIGVWWTLWVGFLLLPLVIGLLLFAHDTETLFIDTVFWMIPMICGTILCLTSGLLLIYLISAYTKIEDGLMKAVKTGKLRLLDPIQEKTI